MMHEVREGEELLCRIGRLALDLGVADGPTTITTISTIRTPW